MSKGFDSRIGKPNSFPSESKSSRRYWLTKLEEAGPFSSERQPDSLAFISAPEIQSHIEAEKNASSKLAEVIKPKLAEDLNVKVELKLEDLLVFKKNNVYVVCKDRSVAEKHLGNGIIEQVTFTDVNRILGGERYRIDIDPSQFSAFQKGSDVHITPNKKFADENHGWHLMSKDELDLSQYFAKRPSDSETDKTIIDLSGPSWEKYKRIIKDKGASVAFGQFLFDGGGEDMKKLLDDFNKLNEVFGKKLSEDSSYLADEYKKAYDKYFNDCLIRFKNKLQFTSVDRDEMSTIIEDAKKALVDMKKDLLEKGFELFIDGDGAQIGELCKESNTIFYKFPEEAQEVIGRRDYHYRDFKASRDEFLTNYFKPKEGQHIAEGGNELIESMEEKLKKSVGLCKWEAELCDRDIEGDFRPKLGDEQNVQFEKFLKSEEGISTKMLLEEIDYLEQKKPWEENLDNSDKNAYEDIKKEFKVDLENFLKNYTSELTPEKKQTAINDLQRKLYSAQNKLYDKHLEKILKEDIYEEKITELKKTHDELLRDQSLVSNPEVRKRLMQESIKCFYAEREIVRASLEGENIEGYAKELEDFLEARNELVCEGIRKAKYPDNGMSKLVGHYENILRNGELHEKLEESLDGVTGMKEDEAKDEIKGFLQDIQDMHENIPKELYNDNTFRKKYREEIASFIDSIEQFEKADVLDRDKDAKQVHSESYNMRNFLSGEMFKVFVSKYQGEDYVKLNNMYSRYVTVLSDDGWTDVANNTDAEMSECHSKEYELLKAEGREEIEDYFSDMTKKAEKSVKFAVEQGEKEVSDALSSLPLTESENKRIENLKILLSESQDLLDNIAGTV